MRGALLGAGVVLMVGVLTGCGGDAPDDAPEEASKKDFCGAFQKLGESGDDFDKSKEAFKDLEDTGTPDDMPDDARAGFELIIDIADEADSSEDAEKKVEDLSKDEQKEVEAFSTYTVKKCLDMPDLPSDLPTELPSDLPTELPSDLTDIPSDLLSPTS